MIEIASGSVIGKSHVRLGRNNQDAYGHLVYPDEVFAVVCDGCGSGMSSEVGAQLGCEIILTELRSDLVTEWLESPAEKDLQPILKEIQDRIVNKIIGISYKVGDYLPNIIKDYFLFTVLVAVVGIKRSFVASIGDGFYAINGDLHQIGPFENNAPPYVAYNAISSHVNRDVVKDAADFQIHATMVSEDVQSIMIGTDGVEDIISNESNIIPGKKTEIVGPVSQFWTDDLYFRNKAVLDRKLVQMARDSTKLKSGVLTHERGYLMDDTTIISIRRTSDECLPEGKED